MIHLMSHAELDGMRVAGRMSAHLLNTLCTAAHSGVTTGELDMLARRTITDMDPKAKSAFLDYHGFPGAVCISVNDELIHGIPGARVLQRGDIVSFDVGVEYKGFIGDNAKTVIVGSSDDVGKDIHHLLQVTKAALDAGVKAVRPGHHLLEVSRAVGKTISDGGCSIVKEYAGHGVGHHLHEDPLVPNYDTGKKGPILHPGMTFCIEPMVNLGKADVHVLKDGWTVVAQDGKPNAHFEFAVAVLEDGVEILTPWYEEQPWTGFVSERGK